MIKAFKNNPARFNDNPDEDTIELKLRPEYLHAVSRERESSAKAVRPAERASASRRSHLPPAPRETPHATDVWLSLSVAAVLGIIALVVGLWPTEQRPKTAAQTAEPTASTVVTFSGSPTHTMLSEAQPSPMQFTNPFDAAEVFEFPPGTTEDAARKSVAEVLLERARERRAQVDSVRHGHRSTVFSIAPSHRSGALSYICTCNPTPT